MRACTTLLVLVQHFLIQYSGTTPHVRLELLTAIVPSGYSWTRALALT